MLLSIVLVPYSSGLLSIKRDELINDMAEVKRKAEAFDEILNVDYIVAPDDYAHEITKIVDKYREEQ